MTLCCLLQYSNTAVACYLGLSILLVWQPLLTWGHVLFLAQCDSHDYYQKMLSHLVTFWRSAWLTSLILSKLIYVHSIWQPNPLPYRTLCIALSTELVQKHLCTCTVMPCIHGVDALHDKGMCIRYICTVIQAMKPFGGKKKGMHM